MSVRSQMPGDGWAQALVTVLLTVSLVAAMPTVAAIFSDTQSVGSNTFTTQTCGQAAVRSVQKGVASSTATGTTTAAITSVDTTKAFLQFSASSSANRPGGATVGGRILNATTLEFIRATGESSPVTITISWSVTEYTCGVSVQRGSVSQTAKTTNVAITALESTASSFFTWSKTTDPAETDWGPQQQTVGELTSTTNLQFRTAQAPNAPATGWYNASWKYRRAITIDHNKVGTSGVSGYTALITLTSDDLKTAAGKVQADADDFLFTSADGQTKVAHEVDTYNGTTGRLDAWVYVNTLSTTEETVFYLYYGNSGAANQQNAGGTWPATSSTWHLNQSPTSEADSSAAANTGTTVGSPTQNGAGVVGGSLTFDGTDDRVNTTNSYALGTATDITVEAWVKTTSTTGKKVAGFEAAQDEGGGSHDRHLWVDTAGKARYGQYDASPVFQARSAVSGGVVNDGNWHYLVGYRSSSADQIGIYVDGVKQTPVGHTVLDSYTGYFRMGGYKLSGWTNGVAGYFTGTIDEVRVAFSLRDQSWVTTTYNNINAPTTFSSAGSEEAAWYSANFAYRKLITIDNTKVDADLTDFPVLVNWASDGELRPPKVQTDGDDIMFTAADGTTKLDHEIETFDSATGALTSWVKVPTVYNTVDTKIWLYYGYAASASNQNATGVWTNSYLAAYHLDEDPSGTAPQMSNSKGTASSDGTTANMASDDPVAAKIGYGVNMNGTSKYISTSTGASVKNLSQYTVSAWVTAGGTGTRKILEESTGNGSGAVRMALQQSSGNVLILGGRDTDAASFATFVSSGVTPATDGTWYHVVGVFNSTSDTHAMVVNGTEYTNSLANATVENTTPTSGMYISRRTFTDSEWWSGKIDEVRISSTARAVEWSKAEYNNQGSPSTFYSVGFEQRQTTQAHTVYWEVVEFTNPSDVKVQRGTTSLATTDGSKNVTIESVDLGRTFALASFSSTASGPALDQRFLRAYFLNATTLRLSRTTVGVAIESVAWQVVELREGSRVQAGVMSFALGAYTSVVTLQSPVDTSRTTVVGSVEYGGGNGMGRPHYTLDDLVGEATASFALTDSSTVTATRGSALNQMYGNFHVVEWGGPATAWSASYGFRRWFSVTAGAVAAPTGYTTSLTFNHAALVTGGQALSSGDDLRVTRWNGSAWVELDRVLDDSSAWNATTTKIWFKSAAAIPASTSDVSYFVHYGNPAATSPPVNKSNVYLLADGFESGSVTTNWTAQTPSATTPVSPWYNASWLYRKKLTIDYTQVSSTLTDFTVAVKITSDTDIGAGARTDGFDLVFTSSDATTALPYEMESFSYSGGASTFVAWVKVPSISNTVNTDFYVYYGNSAATDQQLQNGGPTAAWDANFAAVYHLNEASAAGTYQDSTSNNRDGTFNGTGSLTRTTTGPLAGGQTFDGTNDKVDISDFADNITALTVSAWAKKDVNTGIDVMVGKSTTSTSPTSWDLETDTANAYAQINTGSVDYVSDGSVSLGAWNKYAMTLSSSSLRMYLNEGAGTATATGGATIADTATAVRIGSMQTNGNFFEGDIDEVRISTSARSSAWVNAEYDNQKATSTFFSVGSQQASTTGWYNASWLYRKAFAIDSSYVGAGGVTNFPVMFKQTSDAEIGANARSDGFDLVFTTSDGTPMPYERESFSVSGGLAAMVVYVKFPTLSDSVDTDFYIYYGNASATDQALQNGGPTAVWSGFDSVHHLNETTINTSAGTFKDATSNARNGTYSGTPGLVAATGKFSAAGSGALTFDGSNDAISTSDYGDSGSAFTVSTWINPAVTTSLKNPVSKYGTWESQVDAGNQDGSVTTGGTRSWASAGTNDSTKTITAGTWYLLTVTYDGADIKTFRNGVQTMHKAKTGTLTATTTNVTIGYGDVVGSNYIFNGTIDEVRISPTDRGQAWLTTEYNNMNQGAAFHTESAAEPYPASNPFTIASDQVRTGTYSLKAATNVGGADWLVANGLSAETGLQIDGWWRTTDQTTTYGAFGVRSGTTSTMSMYQGYQAANGSLHVRERAGVSGVTSFGTVSGAGCLPANTWVKVTMAVQQANSLRTSCGATYNPTSSTWTADSDGAPSAPASGTAAIVNEQFTSGASWWVDDVTVRRLVDPEPTVTIPTRNFGDPLASLTLASATSAVAVTSSTPSSHFGDNYRLNRSTSSAGTMTWYKPGVSAITAYVEHWTSEATTQPTFDISTDGSSWSTAGAPSVTTGTANTSSWRRDTLKITGLAATSNYIRITLTGTAGQTWAQQLSLVDIAY